MGMGDLFLQNKTPDYGDAIFGGYERGIRMSDLLQDRKTKREQAQKDNQVNEIISRSIQVSPDGQLIVAPQTLSEIAKVGGHQKMMDINQKIQNYQKGNLDFGNAQAKAEAEWTYNNLNPVNFKDGSQWDAAIDKAVALGHKGAAALKGKFSPETAQAVFKKAETFLAGGPEGVLKLQKGQADIKNTNADTNLKYAQAGKTQREGQETGMTAGQKKVDIDYAKDFNDFTGGGQQAAMDALVKLRGFKKKLDEEKAEFFQAGGGPISGSLPDMTRTQASLSLRDNIQAAANQGLKATFGGQLSDGERKAAAAEYYNDKLDAARNSEILDSKIKELENKLAVQQNKAKYFQQYGTLAGFKPVTASEVQDPKLTEFVDKATEVNIPKWSKGRIGGGG